MLSVGLPGRGGAGMLGTFGVRATAARFRLGSREWERVWTI